MTQTDKPKSNGKDVRQQPDPEVVPRTAKAAQRTFTAEYKAWVLEEAEKCRTQPGGISALLRREGLYSSNLTRWRRENARLTEFLGILAQQPGFVAEYQWVSVMDENIVVGMTVYESAEAFQALASKGDKDVRGNGRLLAGVRRVWWNCCLIATAVSVGVGVG